MRRKAIKDAACLLQEKTTMTVKNMSLALDSNIEAMLKETTQLAFVHSKKKKSSAEFLGNFYVKMIDEEIPVNTGICQLNDDEVLITDTAN